MAVHDLLVLLLLAGLLAPHLQAQGVLDLTTLPVQTEVNTIAQDTHDSTIPQDFQHSTANLDHGTWLSSKKNSSVAGSGGKVVPTDESVSSSDLQHDNKATGKNFSSDDLGKGEVNLTSNDLGNVNNNQSLTSDLQDGEEAESEYYYDDEGNGTITFEDGNSTESEYYYDEDGNSTESEYYYDEDGNSTEGNVTNTNGTMYYDDEDEDEDEESQLPEGVVKKKALHRQVPVEAVAFLGAVGCFLLLLVLFFLYLNKSLCFSECGGFPCIDKPPKKEKAFNKLGEKSETDKTYLLDGSAYQYDEDTSSDSDDEVLQHYQSSLVQGKRGSMHSSVRSAKSGRSRKSDKTKRSGKLSKSPEEQMEDSASLVEKGQASDGVSSPGSDGERESQGAGTEDMSPSVQPSLKTGSMPELDDHHMYENKAFLKDHSVSQFGSEPALSATDRTMSNDEHLFDVSDLQGEPPLISKCGSLEVSFLYEAKRGKMSVTVHQAREIPAKDRGGASNVQVRMMLLPTKKQKFKTKVKVGENPVFEESFAFTKIFPDDVHGMGIRVRLYGLERMRRERMIGESIIGFASLNLDEETTHWMVLEPRSNLSHGDSGFDVSSLSRSDSASSTQSLQHGGMPELLVGLAYNGTTGRLSVEVIKGSNFRNMAMNRAPDTYVKLTLMSPTGQELQRCKTSVRRGQPNPLFKETFMFQVAQFQLPEVTVMVSVYNKKSMKKKEMIGWFSLGMNCSGEEEGSHWSDMRESKGEQVCRWHVLLES